MEAFTPAVKAAKSRGAIFLPQLQFPGRQVPEFLNPAPKSSSEQQLEPCLGKTYGKPTPLTKDEIRDLVRRYVWAAEVLAEAGADGVIVCSVHIIDAWDIVLNVGVCAATCESWVYHATVLVAID